MELLQLWEKELNNRSDQNRIFIENNRDLGLDYRMSKKNCAEIGFNVFTIASDFYYRENFHSYVIAAFLNPSGKHGEGYLFLHQFVKMLNLDDLNVSTSDFWNSQVFTEKHRIDILITDDISKKAIIIENKINDASDQHRQIPRYVDIIKSEYKIEAIVYLTLASGKTPSKIDWTEEEEKFIEDKLVLLPSYHPDESYINFYKNWILPGMALTEQINSKSILSQYGELIKFLNTNTMDTVSANKFFETLKEGDNLDTAISVRNMLNDLPAYLAQRIQEKYKSNCYPFKNIWIHKDRDAVFEAFEIDKYYFKLDVWCSEIEYSVFFWSKKSPGFNIKDFCENKITTVSDFELNEEPNKLHKTFDRLDEESLFDFIDKFLSELSVLKKQEEIHI